MNPMPVNIVSPKKKRFPAVGKIYVKIPAYVDSPFLIGSGEDENSDLDVMRESRWRELAASAQFPSLDTKERETQVLIPSSSIAGVFRSFLRDFAAQEDRDEFRLLFGDEEPGESKKWLDNDHPQFHKTPQSALQCGDIYLDHTAVKVRDGVRIDHQKNLAEEGGKYDYEVVEFPKDRTFDINLEITQRRLGKPDGDQLNVTVEYCHQIIHALIQGINAGQIRIGAKTNKGFGKLRVEEKAVQIALLDFKVPEHVQQWLNNARVWQNFPTMEFKPLEVKSDEFRIEAHFQLRSSLLIRSYSIEPKDPDVVSMESFSEPVIPGPSTRGAIRHRAAKILRTVCPLTGDDKARQWVNDRVDAMFGFVKENPNGKDKTKALRGRVVIEETPVRDVVKEVQTRIKIDRFTGGTIHGALLEAMPLWQITTGENGLCLSMRIRQFNQWEAGLILHILKDLWTGDLAIGGEKSIGRGVLKPLLHRTPEGESYAAKISWDNNCVKLSIAETGAPACSPEDWKKLEDLAEHFNEVIQNAKN